MPSFRPEQLCVLPLHCCSAGAGSGFCFWALAQGSLCCESHRAVNAASWGPSGSQFLYTLHAARAWSHILFLAKSLMCFMYMETGELGPKTTEEREAEFCEGLSFCEGITESPILLEPKLARVAEAHKEMKMQPIIFHVCRGLYLKTSMKNYEKIWRWCLRGVEKIQLLINRAKLCIMKNNVLNPWSFCPSQILRHKIGSSSWC